MIPDSSAASEDIRRYFAGRTWPTTRAGTYLLAERHALLRNTASELAADTSALRICDVGCGAGTDLEMWASLGVAESQLAGTELIVERAEAARRRLPSADIRVVDGFALPFASGVFDMCTGSLVLSTVASEAQRRQLLAEMRRVTAPDGLVVVYDFALRKPWNRHVVAITREGLAKLWRPPDKVRHAAPFLPALRLLLRMPRAIARPLIRLLPRTHRLSIWRDR